MKLRRYFILLLVLLLSFSVMSFAVSASSFSDGAGGTVELKVEGATVTTDGSISESVYGKTNSGFVTTYSQQSKTITITNENSFDVKLTGTITFTVKGGTSTIYPNGSYKIGSSSTVSKGSGTYTVDADYIVTAGSSLSIKITSPGGKDDYISISWPVTAKKYVTYNVEFSSVTGGSYKVNGEAITDATTKQIEGVTGAALEVTPDEGYVCLGFADVSTGKLILGMDTSNNIIFYPGSNVNIMPVFVQGLVETPYSVNSKLYYTWESAMVAGRGQIVLLNQNYTLPTTLEANGLTAAGNYVTGTDNNLTYSIPGGTTLLIPYSDENIFRGTPTDWSLKEMNLAGDSFPDPPEVNIVSAKVWSSTPNVEYRRLTMAEGTHITVNGSLEVSGQTHPLASGQWGNYAVLQMGSNTSITIGSTGTLYAYGYIRGNGTITVASSGVVYEHYDVADYPPSGAGGLDPMNTAGVFGMTNYSFNSVEVPTTYNAGAELRAYLVMTGYKIGTNAFTRTFFGSNSDAIFNLTNGTITKTYSGGRQNVVIAGDVEVNKLYININAVIVNYTVDSSTTSGLPISHNWDITATNNSTVTLNGSVLMYAGSTLTVDNGSKIVIPSDIKLSLLDSESDPSAVTTNAVLDVNGEIQVDGGFYNSYTNTSIPIIKSSGGTGKVIVNNVGSETTFNVRASGDNTASVNITPAKLLNGDNTQYVETASETGTYTYYTSTARWDKPSHFYDETDPVVTAPTCTASGYTTHTCAVCGDSYKDTYVDALGHTAGNAVFETPNAETSTCDRVVYCAVCTAQISRETVNMVHLEAINASADSEIILMLYFTDPYSLLEGASATVTMVTEKTTTTDGETTTNSVEDKATYAVSELWDADEKCYVVSQPAASGEMTSPVTVTFTTSDGSTIPVYDYVSGTCGNSITRTVQDYAERALANGTAKQKEIVQALVTYGGYSQTAFGTNLSNLAYGTTAPDLGTVTIDDKVITTTGSVTGLTQDGQQAFLDSAIKLRVYFVLSSGSIEDYTFTLKRPNGSTATLNTGYEDSNQKYYVDIKDIPAAYLDNDYTITVTRGNETYTVETSVFAYLAKVLAEGSGASEAQKNAAKAMYLYGTAATTFFGK